MSDLKASDLTPRERVWRIVWWLARGDKFTPLEIQGHASMTARGARGLMARMSRVLPVYKYRGRWQALDNDKELNE